MQRIEPVYRVIDELEAALEQVCGADPGALSDGESIVRIHRCVAGLVVPCRNTCDVRSR